MANKRDYYEILGLNKSAPEALRSLGGGVSASASAKASVAVRGALAYSEVFDVKA